MKMDDISLEKAAYCTLNRHFGFEPRGAHRILSESGSATALFSMSRQELDHIMGPYSRFRPYICQEELDKSVSELNSLYREGYKFLAACDEDYPKLLADCPDAPLGLYVRSKSELSEIFAPRPAISIVGTRDMSLYGKEWCRRIVSALSRCRSRPVVVSGLAIGIDITAHTAALECGLPTIAVLPTYITEVYPRRHRAWAAEIAEAPGSALISDYPPGTPPLAVTFLRRNRIIAGLGRATILVESKVRGGGLITANLAFDYSREVFALPGRIDDPRSQGCNRIIRAKVAEPIDDLDSFIKNLGLGTYTKHSAAVLTEELDKFYRERLEDGELGLLLKCASVIMKQRGVALESICSQTGCSWMEAARITGLLEADGFIERDMFQNCTVKFRP